MLWYQGSIAEAVNLSKQRNAIFVVFVEGEDELSSQLSQVISSEAIAKKLGDETNFLNVKLQSGSVNYTHFARIYQFVPVPSLFFLGQNGTPLEVVGAGIAEQNLSSRIDKILEEHRKTIPSISTSTTSVAKEQSKSLIENEAAVKEPHLSTAKPSDPVLPADMPSTSSVGPNSKAEVRKNDEAETSSGPASKIQKTHHEVTKSGQEFEVVCNDDVCVRVPKNNDAVIAAASAPAPEQPQPSKQEIQETSSDTSVEERAERARLLLEARRAEKAREEKEAEKARELERRSRGQGVAELRRWQQEQEMKNLQEERRRDRISEELARQRVLSQIAQDREERKARELAQTAAATAPAPAPAPVDSQPGISTPRSNTGQARIVLKLPDGSAHTVTMRDDDTLGTLRQYVDDNLNMSSAYSLWTAFPRRELTEDDASLLDLSLAPSAAVLVLTAGRATGEVRESGQRIAILSFLSTVFTSFILDPSYRLWSWVQGILFPPTAPSQPSGGTTTTATGPSLPSHLQSGLRFRPRNNIHSLAGERPDDDENNTWNGNSTQQM